LIDEYYEHKEATEAREKMLSQSAGTADGGGRGQRGRQISVNTAPLKSAIFGGWYDQVRPLLRRRTGLKFELPEPVATEVSAFTTLFISAAYLVFFSSVIVSVVSMIADGFGKILF